MPAYSDLYPKLGGNAQLLILKISCDLTHILLNGCSYVQIQVGDSNCCYLR